LRASGAAPAVPGDPLAMTHPSVTPPKVAGISSKSVVRRVTVGISATDVLQTLFEVPTSPS